MQIYHPPWMRGECKTKRGWPPSHEWPGNYPTITEKCTQMVHACQDHNIVVTLRPPLFVPGLCDLILLLSSWCFHNNKNMACSPCQDSGTAMKAHNTMTNGCRKHGDESSSESLSLSSLSKLVLPPLGMSSCSQNPNGSRWRIILPMDSRYRLELRAELHGDEFSLLLTNESSKMLSCRCWEAFMVALVAYSAWVYPFEIAFMHAAPKGGLFLTDNVIDAFFAADIVLTFFVAYIDSRTQVLVCDPRKIATRSVLHPLIYALLHLCSSPSNKIYITISSSLNDPKIST